MTKEEYIVAIEEARVTLNNLVSEARAANNKVDLSITIDKPMSVISLVSVTVN